MADPRPSPWAHSPIEKLYGNSPDLFRAPPPPAPLPIEAKLYGNSPQLFAANLREQQEHWQTQAGFRDPGELQADDVLGLVELQRFGHAPAGARPRTHDHFCSDY